jgi:putative ABC transport system permease protein
VHDRLNRHATLLRLTLIDLLRHPVRTILTATGVALGVATIVALLSLTSGVERAATGLIHLGGAEVGMFQGGVGDLTASALPTDLVPRVRDTPGVADATPVAVATNQLPGVGSFLVFGVEQESFLLRRLVFLAGRAPTRTDEIVLGTGAARELALHVGDRLPLAGGTFRIVGVYDSGVPFEDQGAGLLLPAAQSMRGRRSDVTTIAVSLDRGARADDVRARLDDSFRGTVSISEPGQVARVDTNTLLIRKAAVVFAALALVIGAVAVANTMLMAVFERREEFALLLAVGWPRRLVGALVLQEGVLISLAGALVGIALGVAGGELLVRAFAASGLVVPDVTLWTLARAVLVATAIGAAASVYPAWRITRLRPAEVLG